MLKALHNNQYQVTSRPLQKEKKKSAFVPQGVGRGRGRRRRAEEGREESKIEGRGRDRKEENGRDGGRVRGNGRGRNKSRDILEGR